MGPLPAVQPEDVSTKCGPGACHLRLAAGGAPREYLSARVDYGGYERELDLPEGWGGGVEASLANGQLAVRVLRGSVSERTTLQLS